MRILDVGQCGFDGPRMARLWVEQLHAKVDRADSKAAAVSAVKDHDYDIVLINRILAKDNSPGLDVLREIKSIKNDLPIMLISDHEEAQDEAVKAGALRGFGKSELENPETIELIQRAIDG